MRITSKGQVTIPKEVREQAGLLPYTEVEFVVEDGIVRILKSSKHGRTRGDLVIDALERGRPHFNMTTEEIMRLTRGDDWRGDE